MKRIWFKRDCIKWILEGKKTTTFRSKRHEGFYKVVTGSRYKADDAGVVIELTPIVKTDQIHIIAQHFFTEGDFKTIDDFRGWLREAKLNLPSVGWIHQIKVIYKVVAP